MAKLLSIECSYVALRKESVDRNGHYEYITAAEPVALRKESVDRNLQKTFLDPYGATSLSARRAWIEISKFWTHIPL